MFIRSCIVTVTLICALISGCSISSPTTPAQPEKGNTPEDITDALNEFSQGLQQIIQEGSTRIDPSNPDGEPSQDRDNKLVIS